MINTPARAERPVLIVTYPPPRFCDCGCGQDISHKRADARTFNASCRQRIARDRARQQEPVRERCACGPGALAVADPDGDLRCVMCGRIRRAHIASRITGFDAAAHAMVSDADGQPIYRPRRRRRPLAGWRDYQPDVDPVPHRSGASTHIHRSPFSTAWAA